MQLSIIYLATTEITWNLNNLYLIKYKNNIMLLYYWAFLVAQLVKNLPAVQETWVRYLGWEDPLEKEVATHSRILAWKISWTEEPGGLQSMRSQRVGHDWATNTYLLVLLIYKIFSFSPEVFITIPKKTLAFSSHSYTSFLHSLTEIKTHPFTLHPESDPKYEDSWQLMLHHSLKRRKITV